MHMVMGFLTNSHIELKHGLLSKDLQNGLLFLEIKHIKCYRISLD